MLTTYYKSYDYDHDWEELIKLKPTGKWQLRTGPGFNNVMFVEHKCFLNTLWINEADIFFDNEESIKTFTCN